MKYQIANRIATVRQSVIREIFKETAKNPSIISFAIGNPDPATFPSQDIARISNDILTKDPNSVLQYGPSEGIAPLRNHLKQYLREKEGISFEDNELFLASGGQQCADLTAKILCNDGDTVVVEAPSFVGCMNAFRSYGAKLAGVPMEPDGVNLEALEREFAKGNAAFFYTIPSFQNPTGYTTSAEKRRKIYELAEKYNVMILEDNPYGELRFSGEYVAPIKSLDTSGRVIYAGSFAKVIAPSFRLGILVFPKELTDRFTVAKQVTDVQSTLLFQRIAAAYMTECDYDAHIQSNRAIYREKCELMLSEMEKRFHKSVKFIRPEGGLFVMAFLPEGFDSLPFVNEAVKRGVACVPGTAFEVDPAKAVSGFRMNFAAPSREDIVKGVSILGELTHEWLR